MGAWILAFSLLFYCSFAMCSYEVEELTDDAETESGMTYGPHVRDEQSSGTDEQRDKSFKPSKKLYTLVANSSKREFETVGADDTTDVIYNDVIPFAMDSNDNQDADTPEGTHKSEDQIPSGSYTYDPSLGVPQSGVAYHLTDSPKSSNKKEVHYHQHKHLHEHEHKQEHLHKHDQEHTHSHDHGHKHESRHHHDQHAFHEHQHHGVHHHAHESAHHHDHRATHHHGHKGDHRHGHRHQQKHHHQSQHTHKHQHKGEHKHVHKGEHKHLNKRSQQHQHGSKGRTRRYEESIPKSKRDCRRGCRRRPNKTNGTKH